jgi:two-component system cell cycle response regulator DivK
MQKILLIEDTPDNVLLIQRITQARGYHCLTAGDGAAGLRLAAEERPAIILLDINLPDIDGFEVVARLRADAATRDIPIIAVTANALKGDYEKCLAAGCDDYLAKPFNIDTLVDKLRQFSGGRSPLASS